MGGKAVLWTVGDGVRSLMCAGHYGAALPNTVVLIKEDMGAGLCIL